MRFLLTAAQEKADKGYAGLPAGLEAALILPFSILRNAAALKQAAAAAADFSFLCFAAPEEEAAELPVSAPGRRFIAAHPSLLIVGMRINMPRCAAYAAANGFQGILLRAGAIAPVIYARALRQIQETGLQAGLLGIWQAADIPRLLAFAPDCLGFSGPYERAYATARALLKRPAEQAPSLSPARQNTEQDFIMDKILVSDFIVPMHIGAYAHEKTAAQRVCFNVAAELMPLPSAAEGKPRRPRGMAAVFSYDIILDAILRMAAEEHIELVETAAENLAAFLLSYPQLARITIRVEKLDLNARAVGVEISRSRGQIMAEKNIREAGKPADAETQTVKAAALSAKRRRAARFSRCP